MITIHRCHQDPETPGNYVVVLPGSSPLVTTARWTGECWRRGAVKLTSVYGYAGPIIVEKGRKDDYR